MEIDPDRTMPGEPTVIFLHIGKTAGTTLRQVLRRNFQSSEVMVVRIRRGPREETIERFAALPDAVRGTPRLLTGHTVFGLHEHVPRPCTYITIVRSPSDLVVSQYRFVLRTPGHRHHEIVTSKGMSIENYIRSGISMEMDNSQTRAIAGDRSTPYGQCSDEMLDTAKRNLDEAFAVAGLTERFDETLILLQKTFGWTKLHYVRANVSPRKQPLELTDEAVALIEEHNRFDMELYRYVTDRFEAAIRAYPSFERDLARFRRGNSLYRPWGTLVYTFPHRVSSTLGLRRPMSRTSVPNL